MDYELEFHPVGDATRAGDAISVRYGYHGRHEIIVIDGGTSESGAALVNHIRAFYGAHVTIKHVISTHPDSDHSSGLRDILKSFQVENLWVHGLWHHAAELRPYFADKRFTEEGLAKNIREAYPIIDELIQLAIDQGTQIYEPFAGMEIGPFTVLSPHRDAYLKLVPQFRKTPNPDEDALVRENWLLPSRPNGGALRQLLERVASWVDESWHFEMLQEGAVTAAENETSTVLYGQFGSDCALLTADAGVNGLTWANQYASQRGINLALVGLIQIPHHGSRSNVTPSVLDQLLGPRLPANTPATRMAIVSVPQDDEKHPRRRGQI